MKRLARQIVPRGPRFPLTLSLVAHLGLVGIAARHARTSANAHSAIVAIEFSAPDIERAESRAPEQPAAATVASMARNTAHETSRAAHVAIAASNTGSTAQVPALAPDVGASARDTGPRFAMTVAAATALNSGLTSVNGAAAGHAVEAATTPVAESAVETPARLRLGNAPAYTTAALSAGIEADVPLEIVVNDQGAVVSARGVEHVGYGLDEVALQSVRGYRFTPALRAGKAVPVRMRWLMRFQLR